MRVAYVKGKRAQSKQDDESWRAVAPTVNQFDVGDTRATALVAQQEWVGALRANSGGWRPRAEEHPDMTVGHVSESEDDLLPEGLDSHRYRACGNAVVVNVAEWLGRRIMLDAEGKI